MRTLLDRPVDKGAVAQKKLTSPPSEYNLAAHREALIGRIGALIGKDGNTKRDNKVLRSMLERVKTTPSDDENAQLEMVKDLVKTQFDLQPATRHKLARSGTDIAPRWVVDLGPGGSGEGIEKMAQLVAVAAYAKIVQIYAPDARNAGIMMDPLVDFWNTITQPKATAKRGHVELLKQDRIVQEMTPHLQKLDGLFEKIDEQLGDDTPAELRADMNALREQCGKVSKLRDNFTAFMEQERQLKDRLGIDLHDPRLLKLLPELMIKVFSKLDAIPAPEALTIPSIYHIRLDACLSIVKSTFLLPAQMLEKLDFLRLNELEIDHCFDAVERKMKKSQEELLAGGDVFSAIEYAIAHAEDFDAINLEIEASLVEAKASQRARKKKREEPQAVVSMAQKFTTATTLSATGEEAHTSFLAAEAVEPLSLRPDVRRSTYLRSISSLVHKNEAHRRPAKKTARTRHRHGHFQNHPGIGGLSPQQARASNAD